MSPNMIAFYNFSRKFSQVGATGGGQKFHWGAAPPPTLPYSPLGTAAGVIFGLSPNLGLSESSERLIQKVK